MFLPGVDIIPTGSHLYVGGKRVFQEYSGLAAFQLGRSFRHSGYCEKDIPSTNQGYKVLHEVYILLPPFPSCILIL